MFSTLGRWYSEHRWILLLLLAGALYKAAIISTHFYMGLVTYVTDDAYFSYEVAKNIYLGRGFVIYEGITTNAIPPLYVFLLVPLAALTAPYGAWALPTMSIVLLGLVSLLTAFILYRIALEIYGLRLALLTAGFWLLNPLIVQDYLRGMGGSTLQVLFLALVSYYYVSWDWEWLTRRQVIWVGVLIGLAFLARPDSAWFAIGLAVAIVVPRFLQSRNLRATMAQSVDILGIAVVSLILVSPWLLYSQLRLGRLTPISTDAYRIARPGIDGLSEIALQLARQSVTAILAYNFTHTQPASKWLGLLILLGTAIILIYATWRIERVSTVLRQFDFLVLGAILYYLIGHLFLRSGRGYYMIEEFLIVLLVVPMLAIAIGELTAREYAGETIMGAVLVLGIVISGGALYAEGEIGTYVAGEQMATYIDGNVETDESVAVMGYGVIQYYTDRHDVLMVDDKVNPEALAAFEEGRKLCYVESNQVTYFVGGVLERSQIEESYWQRWNDAHDVNDVTTVRYTKRAGGLLFPETVEKRVTLYRIRHQHDSAVYPPC